MPTDFLRVYQDISYALTEHVEDVLVQARGRSSRKWSNVCQFVEDTVDETLMPIEREIQEMLQSSALREYEITE